MENDYTEAFELFKVLLGFTEDNFFFNEDGSLTPVAIKIGEKAKALKSRVDNLLKELDTEFEDFLNENGCETCMGCIRKQIGE